MKQKRCAELQIPHSNPILKHIRQYTGKVKGEGERKWGKDLAQQKNGCGTPTPKWNVLYVAEKETSKKHIME